LSRLPELGGGVVGDVVPLGGVLLLGGVVVLGAMLPGELPVLGDVLELGAPLLPGDAVLGELLGAPLRAAPPEVKDDLVFWSSSPVAGMPSACWNSLIAPLVCGPMMPSIGPGLWPRFSSCCWTSRTSSDAAVIELELLVSLCWLARGAADSRLLGSLCCATAAVLTPKAAATARLNSLSFMCHSIGDLRELFLGTSLGRRFLIYWAYSIARACASPHFGRAVSVSPYVNARGPSACGRGRARVTT
jgi:hypothetical protein